jgi:hypothetical protein
MKKIVKNNIKIDAGIASVLAYELEHGKFTLEHTFRLEF